MIVEKILTTLLKLVNCTGSKATACPLDLELNMESSMDETERKRNIKIVQKKKMKQ